MAYQAPLGVASGRTGDGSFGPATDKSASVASVSSSRIINEHTGSAAGIATSVE